MVRCNAPTCQNGPEFGLRSFPKDISRRKEWMIRTFGKILTNYSSPLFLCEVHFEPHMWEKIRVDGTRKLKRNAVPTIFEAEDVGLKILSAPDSMETESQEIVDSSKLESSGCLILCQGEPVVLNNVNPVQGSHSSTTEDDEVSLKPVSGTGNVGSSNIKSSGCLNLCQGIPVVCNNEYPREEQPSTVEDEKNIPEEVSGEDDFHLEWEDDMLETQSTQDPSNSAAGIIYVKASTATCDAALKGSQIIIKQRAKKARSRKKLFSNISFSKKCVFCHKRFLVRSTYLKHLKTCKLERSLKCCYCLFLHTTALEMFQHLVKCHTVSSPVLGIDYNVLGPEYQFKDSVKMPEKVLNDDEPVCDATANVSSQELNEIKDLGELVSNNQIIPPLKTPKSFKCDICSYSSFSFNYLKCHMRRKHVQIMRFTCDICGFSKLYSPLIYKSAIARHKCRKKRNKKSYPTMIKEYPNHNTPHKSDLEKSPEMQYERSSNDSSPLRSASPALPSRALKERNINEISTSKSLSSPSKDGLFDAEISSRETFDETNTPQSIALPNDFLQWLFSKNDHLLLKYFSVKTKSFDCTLCSFNSHDLDNFKNHLYQKHFPSDFKTFTCDNCSFSESCHRNMFSFIERSHRLVCKGSNNASLELSASTKLHINNPSNELTSEKYCSMSEEPPVKKNRDEEACLKSSVQKLLSSPSGKTAPHSKLKVKNKKALIHFECNFCGISKDYPPHIFSRVTKTHLMKCKDSNPRKLPSSQMLLESVDDSANAKKPDALTLWFPKKYIQKSSSVYSCLLGDYVSKNINVVLNHIVIKHSSLAKFDCETCHFSRNLPELILKSYRDFHICGMSEDLAKFVCEVCGFSLDCLSSEIDYVRAEHECSTLIDNSLNASGLKTKQVKKSGKKINYLGSIENKYLVRSGGWLTCNICMFSSRRYLAALNHVRYKHLSKSKLFNCSQCGFSDNIPEFKFHIVKSQHESCSALNNSEIKDHESSNDTHNHSNISLKKDSSSVSTIPYARREFLCHLCKFSTTVRKSLVSHIQSEHLKVFSCKSCGFTRRVPVKSFRDLNMTHKCKQKQCNNETKNKPSHLEDSGLCQKANISEKYLFKNNLFICTSCGSTSFCRSYKLFNSLKTRHKCRQVVGRRTKNSSNISIDSLKQEYDEPSSVEEALEHEYKTELPEEDYVENEEVVSNLCREISEDNMKEEMAAPKSVHHHHDSGRLCNKDPIASSSSYKSNEDHFKLPKTQNKMSYHYLCGNCSCVGSEVQDLKKHLMLNRHCAEFGVIMPVCLMYFTDQATFGCVKCSFRSQHIERLKDHFLSCHLTGKPLLGSTMPKNSTAESLRGENSKEESPIQYKVLLPTSCSFCDIITKDPESLEAYVLRKEGHGALYKVLHNCGLCKFLTYCSVYLELHINFQHGAVTNEVHAESSDFACRADQQEFSPIENEDENTLSASENENDSPANDYPIEAVQNDFPLIKEEPPTSEDEDSIDPSLIKNEELINFPFVPEDPESDPLAVEKDSESGSVVVKEEFEQTEPEDPPNDTEVLNHYSCNKCDLAFEDISDLENHIALSHNNLSKSIKQRNLNDRIKVFSFDSDEDDDDEFWFETENGTKVCTNRNISGEVTFKQNDQKTLSTDKSILGNKGKTRRKSTSGVKKSETDEIFFCPFCPYQGYTSTSFNHHFLRYHSTGYNKRSDHCGFCEHSYAKRERGDLPLTSHYPRPYCCPKCKYSSLYVESFMYHALVSHVKN